MIPYHCRGVLMAWPGADIRSYLPAFQAMVVSLHCWATARSYRVVQKRQIV